MELLPFPTPIEPARHNSIFRHAVGAFSEISIGLLGKGTALAVPSCHAYDRL
jgi:hypothetical protein